MNVINPEIYMGNVVKTRVRLARNLVGYPFRLSDETVSREIVKKLKRALQKTGDFAAFMTGDLSPMTLEAMKEKHLISCNLIENRGVSAALVSDDESVSIMVGEEDVLREQCFMKGLRLKEAYERIDEIDDCVSTEFDFSFDDKLGYLTACPTNLGTGLRASVMTFLPALTESGKIKRTVDNLKERGLTVRGLYGEGSAAEGFLYQISNEVTLGVTEFEIIRRVENAVLSICEAERREAERLYTRNELFTMDKAKKSFGVLTNAVLLNYNEFLEHMARVKIAAMLGMIDVTDFGVIDDLTEAVRPASLCVRCGKKLSETDEDLSRAETVRKELLKII